MFVRPFVQAGGNLSTGSPSPLPIAGMGGNIGLKGTDGSLYKKALELGALPVTPARTKDVFAHLKRKEEIELYTAPGEMGYDHVKDFFESPVKVGEIHGESLAAVTKEIAGEMVKKGLDLIIFVGGDGTARDVYDEIGTTIPVVAVPSGVKVFSTVFSYSARAAAERKLEIASHIVENMEKGVLYLLSPGTTLKAVADAADIGKTLLGVDACVDRRLVGEDLNEKEILALFQTYERRRIIITPIGGNGFNFGRGSKQFTPEVIRGVGKEHILVTAEPSKLNKLDALRVDTGDYELDRVLSGYIRILVGERYFVKIEVRC